MSEISTRLIKLKFSTHYPGEFPLQEMKPRSPPTPDAFVSGAPGICDGHVLLPKFATLEINLSMFNFHFISFHCCCFCSCCCSCSSKRHPQQLLSRPLAPNENFPGYSHSLIALATGQTVGRWRRRCPGELIITLPKFHFRSITTSPTPRIH